MITKEQAIAAGDLGADLHYDLPCKVILGPRGGKTYHIQKWRVNGKCKTWKTRPNNFRLPVKYGFNGPYDYITNYNCDMWHFSDDCPALKGEENENYKNL
jgi:hypothetical protein